MQPRLPDFYVPEVYMEIVALGTAVAPGSAGWPSANLAIYVPVIFPVPCTLNSIRFGAGNGTGNYDLGLYDGYTKLKLASSGSTAMSALGAKILTFSSPIRVDSGHLYYAALALSSTTGQTYRTNSALASMIGVGIGQQATSLPLPSTMAPVTVTGSYAPYFVFGIR